MKMYKSIFIVKKMDCPSEKSLIEIKLGSILAIKKLDFDLDKKNLLFFIQKKMKKLESI